MFGKRKAVINGVALLVSLALLLVSVPVAKGWDGDLRTLLAAWTWSSSNTDATGYFYNSSTGMGLRGYSYGYMGLAGYGPSYGTYGSASGSSGQGVRGYSSGSYGYGVFGYSPNFVGVGGSGGSWGGSFTSGNSGAYNYGGTGYGSYNYSANYMGVGGFGDSYGTYGSARASSSQGVRGYSAGSYGYGVYGYAPGSAGDGVYGYGPYFRGVTGVGGLYGGYFIGGNRGVYGQGTTGFGVYGYSEDSYAAVFVSGEYRGLYANGASGYYDAYFPDWIRAGSTTISSFGISLNALNDGDEPLEPGDLVVFSGVTASAGDSRPTLAVEKANGANSGAIVGVVQKAYIVEKVPVETVSTVQKQAQAPAAPAGIAPVAPKIPLAIEGEKSLLALGIQLAGQETAEVPEPPVEVPPEADPVETVVERFVDGPAQPGQYVIVMMQGIAQVKVDASAAPVRAGDALVASRTGYAQANSQARMEALGKAGPVVIGRALESLETGKGTIHVFVSVR